MEKQDENEKVTIICNRVVMSLLGLMIGQNFESMIEAYEKEFGVKPVAIEGFRSIINQMQNAFLDDLNTPKYDV